MSSKKARALRDTQLLDGIEELARRGDCPGIINDDHGHWAVTGEGIQTMPFRGQGACDLHTTFIVPAGAWHPTLREAIRAYLDQHLNTDEQQ